MYRDLPVNELEQRYYSQTVETATVDGVNIRYQEQGTGPVVLLIHSHYFSMNMWDEWMAPLSSRYRVIRFDMTSHGLTGADPSNDYSMARSQQLIEGLLNHLEVDELSIVGSSLGGNMAFTYAANHPDKVNKLVLMNSGGLKRDNARSGTIPAWVDTVFKLLPETLFKKFLSWMIVDDELVSDAMVGEFHDMLRREGNRSAELNRIRSFNIGDPDTVLAKVTAPVQVMWGKGNPQLSYTLTERFKTSLLNAESVNIKIYEGVGHVLPLEIPQQGAADVLTFLEPVTKDAGLAESVESEK